MKTSCAYDSINIKFNVMDQPTYSIWYDHDVPPYDVILRENGLEEEAIGADTLKSLKQVFKEHAKVSEVEPFKNANLSVKLY